jgi:hypothetical protein
VEHGQLAARSIVGRIARRNHRGAPPSVGKKLGNCSRPDAADFPVLIEVVRDEKDVAAGRARLGYGQRRYL